MNIDIRMVLNLGRHKYTFYLKLPKSGAGARAPWSLCEDAHDIKHSYLYLFMQLKCILNVTYLDEVEWVSNACGECAGNSSKVPARLSFGWIDYVGHWRLQRKPISLVLKD